jgi:prepilin-type N-terminal cleavage/methylation domain-containing protein
MKITKLKPRNGYTLIEMIVVLVISLTSVTLFKYPQQSNELFVIDALIFTNMMNSISLNKPIAISYQDQLLNTYYPTHAFAISYTKHIKNIELVFHIGRGYYVIKKRF